MKYRYDSNTGRIESGDPNIGIQVLGAHKDGPMEWAVELGNRKIGFTTVTPSRFSPDGLVIWEVDRLCVIATRWDYQRKVRIYSTNIRKFESYDEQNLVITVITEGLSVFGGRNPDASGPERIREVLFTPDLQKRIDRGEFLK